MPSLLGVLVKLVDVRHRSLVALGVEAQQQGLAVGQFAGDLGQAGRPACGATQSKRESDDETLVVGPGVAASFLVHGGLETFSLQRDEDRLIGGRQLEAVVGCFELDHDHVSQAW